MKKCLGEQFVSHFGWMRYAGQTCGSQLCLAAYRLHTNSRAANKFHVAKNRWKIYRTLMSFSVTKARITLCNM